MSGEGSPPSEPSVAVLIDVDEAHGALVLNSDEEHQGLEPEIQPAGDPSGRTHVWVLPRQSGDRVNFAAVFPSLPAGRYQVLGPEGDLVSEVEVPPGVVTEANWP